MAVSQLAEYLFQRLSGMNKTCEWGKLGTVCREVLALQDEAAIDDLLQTAREKGIHTHPAF
jgi:hypothetical protein